eukprot:TRINITY_DN3119_c0_g1_i1.p1 TRINITY_DN3119_c0_g1~~TRINITY_DN3119_c0_g1_i1.p1  ORF type:complete len:346 (+),score=66.32 TRINITY_DN3119_c0_g1_i1:84-1121(+)
MSSMWLGVFLAGLYSVAATRDETQAGALSKCTISSNDASMSVSFPVSKCATECIKVASWPEAHLKATSDLNVAKQFAQRFESSWRHVQRRCVCSAGGVPKIQFKLRRRDKITAEDCKEGTSPKVQLKCWQEYQTAHATNIVQDLGKNSVDVHRATLDQMRLNTNFYHVSRPCVSCLDGRSCFDAQLPSVAERLPLDSKRTLAMELNKIRSGEFSLQALPSSLKTLMDFSDKLVITDADQIQFSGFNANGDGNLDQQELLSYFVNGPITEEDVLRALHKADSNNDGVISLDEFRAFKDALREGSREVVVNELTMETAPEPRYRLACLDEEGKEVSAEHCADLESRA